MRPPRARASPGSRCWRATSSPVNAASAIFTWNAYALINYPDIGGGAARPILLILAKLDGGSLDGRLIVHRRITHEQLAGIVGATRQWVTSMLAAFRPAA
jgi:hypothetical protein